MARKKQQLINYHTSTVAMPQAVDVQLGELVVRHATDRPELLIKKDNNEFATFVDSGKVQSMITASSTDLQGKIDAISKDLKDNYATSASTVAAIKAVDDKLTKDYATSASTVAAIKAVDTKLTTKYADSASTVAAIGAVDTKLTRDYATSASTVAAIKAVDDKLTKDYATSADTVAAIDVVNSSVTGLSANVHTRIESLETGLTNTINEKVARAYRYKGSCTYAELPESGSVIGEVWNVTDAHNNFPAGTNYAWNGAEWDALGGSVDLSPYALKTEVTGATKTLQDNIDAANLRIDTVSGNLNTFKTDVANTYATKTDVSSDIKDAKDSVYSSATTVAAADAQEKANTAKSEAIAAAAASADTLNKSIETVDGRVDTVSASLNTFKTYVADTYETKDNVATAITSVYSSATTAAAADAKTKADTAYSSAITAAAASAQTLQNNINTVNSSVTGLSASTVNIETTANSAIQTASIVDGDTCKVSVNKVNTELQFNFENLVVDCGEF